MLAQGISPDSIRRALGDVFARPAYQWVEQRSVRSWLRLRWDELREWIDALRESDPALFNVLLVALVLLLAALLLHIGYVLWRVLRRSAPAAGPTVARTTTRSSAGAHFARADELAAAGKWVEALGHHFLALVLELDRRRAVRFHPSKTPAEYISEARLDPPGRASLRDVVGRLYRHVFGAAPCDADAYDAFGRAAQVVMQHVRPH